MQITLIVEEEALDIIGAALQELPYKHSAKILEDIITQYKTQKETQKDKPLVDNKD